MLLRLFLFCLCMFSVSCASSALETENNLSFASNFAEIKPESEQWHASIQLPQHSSPLLSFSHVVFADMNGDECMQANEAISTQHASFQEKHLFAKLNGFPLHSTRSGAKAQVKAQTLRLLLRWKTQDGCAGSFLWPATVKLPSYGQAQRKSNPPDS